MSKVHLSIAALGGAIVDVLSKTNDVYIIPVWRKKYSILSAYQRSTVFVFVFAVLFCAGVAQADHAIAMHGEPLYGANFTHFLYANPDAPKRGVYKEGKTGIFTNLNPVVITGELPAGIELLTDQLMQRTWDEPFTLYGLVAESIDVAPDRSWITFHLNEKARFHDGHPMTTEDVLFSFNAYKTHGHPVRRTVFGLVKDVEVHNKHSITFRFGKGYDRESVMILALLHILPKHYWADKDISATTIKPPLGSGPYEIAAIDPGRKIIYKRVKDYWAANLPVNKGHFNFDAVEYSYFRDDSIALEAFKAGEYDLRREENIRKWETGYTSPALERGEFTKKTFEHHRPVWTKGLIFNTRRPLFQDVRVRKALSLAFNYGWLKRAVFYDSMKPITSTFSNSYLAPKGRAENEEFDLLAQYLHFLSVETVEDAWQLPPDNIRLNRRKAMQLLKEAGWHYKDMRLVDEKDQPFIFEILLSNPADEKIALNYVRELNILGIRVKVRTVDSAQFMGRLQRFDYDMVSFRWINTLSPGAEQLNNWGSIAARTPGSRNYAGVQNEVVDRIAASIAFAKTREELVTRARALDRVIMHNYYFIPLFYADYDRIAYWRGLAHPEKVSLYGTVLESWWRVN